MIHALALMIGAYIFVRLCEIYESRPESKALRFLCILALIVTIACVVDIIIAGGQAQRQLQSLPGLPILP